MSEVLAIIPAWCDPGAASSLSTHTWLGKPLLVHAIDQARQAPSITAIVVGTHDPQAAEIARRAGAQTILLDRANLEHPSDWAMGLQRMLAQISTRPRLLVVLGPSTPLRPPGIIEAAIASLIEQDADSLFSAILSPGPLWRRDRQSTPQPDPQTHLDSLIETRSIYVLKPWVLEQGKLLGGKITYHLTDPVDTLWLRDPADLEPLEFLARCPRYAGCVTGLDQVRMLVLDFDGVMTDNRVVVHQDGSESVTCHRGDGLGIGRVQRTGIEVMVISKEINPVVTARCRKLGLEVIQGCDDKLPALQAEAARRGLGPAEIAYMGNDINDLACLRWVGLPIAVADALPEVLRAARWVTRKPGGWGAIREVADRLVAVASRK